jgi:hypothetical protein
MLRNYVKALLKESMDAVSSGVIDEVQPSNLDHSVVLSSSGAVIKAPMSTREMYDVLRNHPDVELAQAFMAAYKDSVGMPFARLYNAMKATGRRWELMAMLGIDSIEDRGSMTISRHPGVVSVSSLK